MKIHGLAWLIVGGFAIGFSYYISSINEAIDTQKFMLFIVLGGVFCVIGLFKLIMSSFSRNKPKLAKENFPHHKQIHRNHHGHYSSEQHHEHSPLQNQHKDVRHIKYCSSCGATLRTFDRFCYKCGNRQFSG